MSELLQRYRDAIASFVQTQPPTGAPSVLDERLLALFATNAAVADVALELLGDKPRSELGGA